MDDWTRDMRGLWQRATSGMGWGIWKHHDTGTKPVDVPLTASGTGTLSMPGWHAVTTLDGKLCALTLTEDMAALLANVPDLMEPCLRPGSADAVTTPGIPLPEDAHEAGWQDGCVIGEARAYREASEVMDRLFAALAAIPDPEVQGAVEAARQAWQEEQDEWPAVEDGTEPDNDDRGGPSDPRPVC